MNTAVKTQGKNGTEHQEILKVKEEWAMKTAMGIKKVNIRLHETLAMKTPVKLLGGLALGALLMAATTLPLGTASADEPARPLSSEQNRCYPEISNDCLVLPDHELSYNTAARALSDQQSYRIQGFEAFGIPLQIDEEGMVVEAVQKPVASRPLSNMEIERLDYQIDGMLSAAAQTPSVDRPLSDEKLGLILDYEMTGLPNPNFTYDELMQAKVGSEPALEQ